MSLNPVSINLGDDVREEFPLKEDSAGRLIGFVPKKLDENFLELSLPSGWTLPGHGKQFDDNCGRHRSRYVSDFKEMRIKRFSCHHQSCPICFRSWARMQSEKTAGQLWGFTTDFNKKIAHWIFSPAPDKIKDIAPEKVFKLLDKELRAIIEQFSEWNDTVVAVVRHSARKQCPKCFANSETESYCKSCQVAYVWYYSPHLHVTTSFVYEYRRVNEFVAYELEHQVLFKQIAMFPTKNDLANCLAYELGHSHQIAGKQVQSVRYLAFSAKTHFRSEVTKVREPITKMYRNSSGIYVLSKFYEVRRDTCETDNDRGFEKVTIHPVAGELMYERDGSFNRKVLYKTLYNVKLVPIQRFDTARKRWMRIVPPRALKSIIAERPRFWTIAAQTYYCNVPTISIVDSIGTETLK